MMIDECKLSILKLIQASWNLFFNYYFFVNLIVYYKSFFNKIVILKVLRGLFEDNLIEHGFVCLVFKNIIGSCSNSISFFLSLPEIHYMFSILGACNFYCVFLVIRLTCMYYCQCCVKINFVIYHLLSTICLFASLQVPWVWKHPTYWKILIDLIVISTFVCSSAGPVGLKTPAWCLKIHQKSVRCLKFLIDLVTSERSERSSY